VCTSVVPLQSTATIQHHAATSSVIRSQQRRSLDTAIVGMETGGIEFVMLNATLHVSFTLFGGSSLPALETQALEYIGVAPTSICFDGKDAFHSTVCAKLDGQVGRSIAAQS
jgi:hypothetical protein